MNTINAPMFWESLFSHYVILFINSQEKVLSLRMHGNHVEFFSPPESLQSFFLNDSDLTKTIRTVLESGKSRYVFLHTTNHTQPVHCLVYPENSNTFSLLCYSHFNLEWMDSASLLIELADVLILLDSQHTLVGMVNSSDIHLPLFSKNPHSGLNVTEVIKNSLKTKIDELLSSPATSASIYDLHIAETGHYYHISKMEIPQGTLLLFNDTTDIKKKQKEAYTNETLETIKELAGAIAHEFSQPIQALKSVVFFLENEPGNKEYIQMAKANIDRIADLSKRLSSLKQLQRKSYLDSFIIDLDQSAPLPEKTTSKQLLIVEDEPEIREAFQRYCTHLGYKVYAATNGKEAVSILEKNEIHLIISDIYMPQMDGIALFNFWKEAASKGKFLFLTGYEINEEQREKVADADGLLYKPIDLTELEMVIKALIGKPD